MKIKLTLLLALCSTCVFSQNLQSYIRIYDRAQLIKKFNKNEVLFHDSIASTKDTLVGYLKTEVQTIKLKLNFDTTKPFQYCIRQEEIFDCSCAEKSLDNLLKLKSFDWVESGENQYISNYFNSTKLEVQHYDETSNCLIIVLSYIEMDKKEYKTWYKKLKLN